MILARLDEMREKSIATMRRGPRPFGVGSAQLWTAAALIGAGVVTWGAGQLASAPSSGIAAAWLFVGAAILLAFALPLPYALVSPLFVGLLGWLVDMLPLVILAGWTAVVTRWALSLLRERRLPRAGRWVWLVVGLAAWTTLGVVSVSSEDLKHFTLLVGIQFIISGVMLTAFDSLRTLEDRLKVVTSIVLFVVIMSAGAFLDFAGAPVQELQYEEISNLVEEAYGLDAFPNNLEMINYVLSSKGGGRGFRATVDRFAEEHPALPSYEVHHPPFRAFDNHFVLRFAGSAREFEDELHTINVDLLYDNIGLSPMNTVPRFRSFARNSLTYAGTCVVAFPLACFLAWRGRGRRRLLGRVGMFACLLGAGFTLARGAWIAIAIGIVYLVVDGKVTRRLKGEAVAAFLLSALIVIGFFLARYSVDPLNARALGAGSVQTRASVYEDTVESLSGIQVLFGFGTETPRTESGETHAFGRYIPSAGTHSTYLNYLFRTGVPGAIGIIALYAIAALHGRAAAVAGQGDERILATLLTVAVVSAAAHAVILSLYVEPIYTLSVSVVLTLAVIAGTNVNASVIPWRTRSRRP